MPFVKPAAGLVIPDLDRNDVLPPEGRQVPETDFWLRRLRDGDVVLTNGPPTEAPAAPTIQGA
jgi:hypothetical protein